MTSAAATEENSEGSAECGFCRAALDSGASIFVLSTGGFAAAADGVAVAVSSAGRESAAFLLESDISASRS